MLIIVAGFLTTVGASPYTIDFSDPELVLPGVNEIAVRVDPSLDPICPRRPRQRMNFELPDIPQ